MPGDWAMNGRAKGGKLSTRVIPAAVLIFQPNSTDFRLSPGGRVAPDIPYHGRTMPDRTYPGLAVSWRRAAVSDVPAIEALIAISTRGLCVAEYPAEFIAAALGSAWGCDTELIRDGTYFVAESAGRLAACGGWGKRKTLFGSDKQ